LKVFFFFIFTSVILGQSLQGFFTLVNWKINQTEITEKYCENKNTPMLNCNGKCYLAKQLKKQEDVLASELDQNNKKIPTPKKVKESDVSEEIIFSNLIISSEENNSSKHCFYFNFKYSIESVDSFFHPPQFV